MQITKLRIGDDGYGRGKTMFVEEVTVTSKDGDTVLFPCRCWLGKDDSNTKIIRELVPGKPVPEELEGKCNFKSNFLPHHDALVFEN